MTSRFLRPARNETEGIAALFRGFCVAAGRKKDAVSVNNRINQRFPNLILGTFGALLGFKLVMPLKQLGMHVCRALLLRQGNGSLHDALSLFIFIKMKFGM